MPEVPSPVFVRANEFDNIVPAEVLDILIYFLESQFLQVDIG